MQSMTLMEVHVISDLNRSLSSQHFLYNVNERTSFAS